MIIELKQKFDIDLPFYLEEYSLDEHDTSYYGCVRYDEYEDFFDYWVNNMMEMEETAWKQNKDIIQTEFVRLIDEARREEGIDVIDCND